MSMSLDKMFSANTQNLTLRTKRAEMIASNIANADTPGYKAQGMNFQKMLTQASKIQQTGMTRTNEKHFDIRTQINNNFEYRTPNQPDTGDGNTVDVQVERNLYLENSMQYQTSLEFLTGKIKGIKKAIIGGQS